MIIGDRLRALREAKHWSQNELQKRSGFARTYISGVENGHMTPSVKSLEKWARALKVPLYELLYEGEKLPKVPRFPKLAAGGNLWSSRKETRFLIRLCRLLAKMSESDRKLLFFAAQRMARR